MPPRTRSLGEVVQAPVVTVMRQACDAGQRRREIRPGIMFEMLDDGAIGAAEICLVPDINRGDGQLPSSSGGAARVIDIVARRSFEQRVGVRGGERLGLQVRAAEGGAIDGV